jgi:hypothetical protein
MGRLPSQTPASGNPSTNRNSNSIPCQRSKRPESASALARRWTYFSRSFFFRPVDLALSISERSPTKAWFGSTCRRLGGAELPSRKNPDQFLRKMATDGFQVFGRRAGQQDVGPLANFAEAPKFIEEFQNDFGVERGTKLITHIQIPQVTRAPASFACPPPSLKVPGARVGRTSPHRDNSATYDSQRPIRKAVVVGSSAPATYSAPSGSPIKAFARSARPTPSGSASRQPTSALIRGGPAS